MSDGISAPTIEEFKTHPWEDVARTAEIPTYSHFQTKFGQKVAELEEAGDTKTSLVYRFLGAICFIHLQPDNKDQPLRAGMISASGKSAAIEDFNEQARDVIEQLVGATSIPLLKARFADMIWLLRKDHKMAEIAANEYLAAFKQVDDGEKWAYEFECLKRGIALARMVGAKKNPFLDYIQFVEDRLSSLETTGTDSLGTGLLDLLFEYRAGDPVVSARIAETIGDRLEATNSFLSRDYYDIAAKFHRANGDIANAQRLGMKKGESLVRQAEGCVGKKGQGYFTATHHLAIAIECFRQSGAGEGKIESLHKQLIDWQGKASGEMKSFSQEVDVWKAVEAAKASVKGKSLRDAIFAMALGHPITNPTKLRERVTDIMNKYPMTHLFPATFTTRDGRVMAHKPPGLSTDEETREAAIQAEMFHQASSIDWNLRAQAYIDVCRQQINEEHEPAPQDLHFLVLHNPFIPPGHEALFLKGIIAGFRGDFDITAHFLVPQIEESIRYILQSAGYVTSKLDSKLIQEQRLLGTLLSLPETAEILHADHVFELRGILCEKFGYDLRNRLAHGFVTYQECWSADVLNLWWLVIRLLSFPAARKAKKEASNFDKKADTE